MTTKSRPFRELRSERLANPDVAARYLEVTREQNPEHLAEAIRRVAEAASARASSQSTASSNSQPGLEVQAK